MFIAVDKNVILTLGPAGLDGWYLPSFSTNTQSFKGSTKINNDFLSCYIFVDNVFYCCKFILFWFLNIHIYIRSFFIGGCVGCMVRHPSVWCAPKIRAQSPEKIRETSSVEAGAYSRTHTSDNHVIQSQGPNFTKLN